MFATARYLSEVALFAAKRRALVGAASFVLAVGASAQASAGDFAVTYSGSGTYGTRYQSEPPNQGGMHDTDTATDSESQRWSLRFTSPLRLPCAGAPCARVTAFTGAQGATSITAQISHVHLDGLYSQLNASVQCSISSSTPPGAILGASLRILAGTRPISITAFDPLGDALLLLPSECPGQGDSIDGLLDNYLGPGLELRAGLRARSLVHLGDGDRATTAPARSCDDQDPAVADPLRDATARLCRAAAVDSAVRDRWRLVRRVDAEIQALTQRSALDYEPAAVNPSARQAVHPGAGGLSE